MVQAAHTQTVARGSRAIARGGFTLIEVLIGVIVLGLGLLGLAAVFPAVVLQQRQASDAIEGETLVESAKGYMRSSMTFAARRTTPVSPAGSSTPAFLRLARAANVDGEDGFSLDGAWVVPSPAGNDVNQLELGRYGEVRMRAWWYEPAAGAATATQVEFRVPMADRLIPQIELRREPRPDGDRGRDPEPRYVWDFMLRRALRGDGADAASDGDTLQAAVFVRRLDGGIRRRGRTLVELLTPDQQGRTLIVPVGADDVGRPTLNGEGDSYSRILTFDGLQVVSQDGRRVNVRPDDERLFESVTQLGQKLVGRTGIVHTVLAIADVAGETQLTVEPGFTEAEGVAGGALPVWFTPQVPVAVEVFDVTAN